MSKFFELIGALFLTGFGFFLIIVWWESVRSIKGEMKGKIALAIFPFGFYLLIGIPALAAGMQLLFTGEITIPVPGFGENTTS